jgi:hypothetical protein
MSGPERILALSSIVVLCATLVACSRDPKPVEVIISLDKASGPLSSATILVDYSQAQARLAQRSGRPACASILPHVTADFSDDAKGSLTVHARSPEGFSAPVDLAVCRMIPERENASAETISARLRISLTSGVDLAGRNLDDRQLALTTSRTYTRASDRMGERSGRESGQRDRGSATSAREQRRGERGGSERRLARGGEARQGSTYGQGSTGRAVEEPDATSRNRSAAGTETARAERRANDAATNGPRYGGGIVSGGSASAGSSSQGTGADNRSSDAAADTGPSHGGDSSAGNGDDGENDVQAVRYAVTVGVTSHSGVLGALQFDVTHLGSSGGFVGAGGSVDCNPDVDAALTSFNDRGNGRLSAAFVDLQGFQTPTAVATCRFKTREQLAPTSFQVTTTDASGPDLQSSKQLPTMEVLDVYQVP